MVLFRPQFAWQSRSALIESDQPFDCAPLLASGVLSSDPEVANGRLYVSEGSKPWRNGLNVPAITALRGYLGNVCPAEFIPAFIVIAPHSHWSAGVLVERYDSELARYWLGPSEINGPLRPYSFAFSATGLVPYEYADESVPIDDRLYQRAIAMVRSVEAKIISEGQIEQFAGLGLSIDHRFKAIGERTLFSTMEHQCHQTHMAYVEIDLEVGFRAKIGIGQVGWSAWAHELEAERDFMNLMRAIEEIVDGLPPEEARQFIQSLD